MSATQDYMLYSSAIAYAVELYLKSYLFKKAVPLSDLKGIGHNLSELFTLATAKGLPSVPKLDELVAHLSDPHKKNVFRYYRSGETLNSTNWDIAFPVIDQLDVIVDEEVGASAVHGLSARRA